MLPDENQTEVRQSCSLFLVAAKPKLKATMGWMDELKLVLSE